MPEKKMHMKDYYDCNYLGSHHFEKGQEQIFTIAEVKKMEVFNQKTNSNSNKMIIHWKEKQLPWIVNVTNRDVIAKLYNSEFPDDWVGKTLQLYVTAVKVGREFKDAVRVKNFIPVTTLQKCDSCSAEIKPFKGFSLADHIEKTKQTYGKQLCTECATKLSQEKQSEKKSSYKPQGDE